MADPPRLVTIPISHFCEKARWALDFAGIDYVEERHIQMVHRLYALRAGGGRRVPVLRTPGGTISGSAAIVRWADRMLPQSERLVPAEHRAEIDELEARLDSGYGIEGRRWMYSVLVADPEIPRRWGTEGLPGWERRGIPLLLPLLRRYLSRFLEADPQQAASALAAVERTFDEIEERIADGRRYLIGDRFTAADLAFAALSAPVLLPERYGVKLPQPVDLPAEAAAVVERLRARPAGAFALRLIDEHRPWPPRGRLLHPG